MKLFRTAAAFLVLLGAVSAAGIAPVSAQTWPQAKQSEPGELTVVSINALQLSTATDDARVKELADVVRTRLLDSNDGVDVAPDVIMVNELYYTEVPPFEQYLSENFAGVGGPYQLFGGLYGMKAKFFINTATVAPVEAISWADVCLADRTYQIAKLQSIATDQAFAVSGVHFNKAYSDDACRRQNVHELRTRLSGIDAPVVAAGDFNHRAMNEHGQCDPYETSGSLSWYSAMTESSTDGRSYTDAVRARARAGGLPLSSHWTHEWDNTSTLCDGSMGYRRNRIDYLFTSGLSLVDAQTDDPGWAGEAGGTFNTDYCSTHPSCKYSDHRVVWGRFGLPGEQVAPANQAPQASFDVSCTYLDCNFSDVSSDVDGTIASRAWKFGDGSSSSADSPSHSFAAAGTYTVTLTVTDDDGASATASKSVTVAPDTKAPVITNVRSASVTGSSATITWTTDEGSTSQVEFWTGTKTHQFTVKDAALLTSHSATLSGLAAKTKYSYVVISVDKAGNTARSSTYSFMTARK